ncbi:MULTISPECIES: hypothetical protein [unclassified Brevundimonas]|uniref:hypothetical protein n=1 Tax=unclassified Brevundimonas TaxID=2622653 RepID=UPI000CFB1241|nr:MULTISPECIES: hypothetical protein [unclassified Brevundimonas]PRA31998.1 hypothetical protein CQ024_06020 [Brevundimonas sp. MYb27]PQZ82738.1 hypothetical protein CQ026_08245 [Brevundimonas sp. MYb31]PRB16976.1 hypothetical protein CQ039_04885 [Brevundimonas sp. MYb52]PRB37309.1 hypothetical protein CQ035_03110 [Brevundimonas sp. MYb46]PRB54813.1 hypothetical protein CQ028_03235 [Brevundimonas sp. MYb33]
MGVRATSLLALALAAGLSACTFKPMEPAAPESAGARLERVERERREEGDKRAYCQRLSRDDPRFDRDDCKRQVGG